MPLLTVKDLYHTWPDGTWALRGVSLTLGEDEKLALIGPNGSGKSTLLALLSGCLPVTRGEIFLEDKKIPGTHVLRESVGMIFQDPDDQLFMPSVLEDVAFGLIADRTPVEEARSRARTVMEKLGVSFLAERSPHRLSGGEKRLVALAGILVMDPSIIALDEPSASLDPGARRRVIDVLKTLDRPMILATHDLDMALDVCTAAVILSKGRITAEGALPDLLTDETLLRESGLEPPLSFAGSFTLPQSFSLRRSIKEDKNINLC